MAIPDPWSGANRRSAERIAVRRPARLILPRGVVLPVTVVDVSASGARAVLAKSLPAPAEVQLVELGPGQAHVCAVAWQKGMEIGLKFLRSRSLDGLVPGEFQAAKAAWLAARGG